jgi:hypothetical protein
MPKTIDKIGFLKERIANARKIRNKIKKKANGAGEPEYSSFSIVNPFFESPLILSIHLPHVTSVL